MSKYTIVALLSIDRNENSTLVVLQHVVHPHLAELLSAIKNKEYFTPSRGIAINYLFTVQLLPVIEVLSVFHYFLGNFSNFFFPYYSPLDFNEHKKKRISSKVGPSVDA